MRGTSNRQDDEEGRPRSASSISRNRPFGVLFLLASVFCFDGAVDHVINPLWTGISPLRVVGISIVGIFFAGLGYVLFTGRTEHLLRFAVLLRIVFAPFCAYVGWVNLQPAIAFTREAFPSQHLGHVVGQLAIGVFFLIVAVKLARGAPGGFPPPE